VLLEAGDINLIEGMERVKIYCNNCGYMVLLDAETLGMRGCGWKGRVCSPFAGSPVNK
jgi:hypothetical protein